ncbi:MAG: rhodanese-like domain-containing protein [Bdellovibrionaceae bacterium]|nr:rhodanese-like domain-containing protein [Pseudobdellovibrionaceae bacterium]
MSSILFLGEYQLRNLVKNQILFWYFDCRQPASRARQDPGHWIFRGAIPVTLDAAVSRAASPTFTKEHPIVLICENGETSMTVAQELEKLGHTNVFVLRGGTEELDLSER